MCRKRCQSGDVVCALNETQTIIFQTIALPSVPFLPRPLLLTSMRAVAPSGGTFHTDYSILEGNEQGWFDILKGQGVGEWK